MNKLVLLALLTINLGWGQNDPSYTADLLNCRGWRNTLPEKARAAYTMGLVNGISAAVIEMSKAAEAVSLVRKFMAAAFTTYDEYLRGINDFCASPENAIVPVPWAMQVFAMKANGKSSAEVDSEAAMLRKFAAGLQSEQKK
jgi:hypothetical protein